MSVLTLNTPDEKTVGARVGPDGGSKTRLWAGRIIGGFLALFLLVDGVGKLIQPAPVVEGSVRLGYPESLIVVLGAIELACTIAYLIPRTSVLGAILLTAYLGGATAAHVRLGDPFLFPIVFGVLIWAGLVLRDDRLRGLIHLRTRV